MKKTIIFLTLLTGFVPALVYAQDTLLQHLPPTWTLENSIAYAKQNNITVNTQKLNTRLATEDLSQSKAAKLPSLSGSVSQSMVNSSNADPVVGGFQTQANFSSNYSLSSSFVLYNGNYIKNDVKAKELSLKAANLNVQQTENDITLSITQAFLNILLAKENIVYMEEVLATSREQLKQGQQQFDAGNLSRKELLQFESQVATDEYNLVNANNTYRQNNLTLKQLLLLPSTYNFEVTVPANLNVPADTQPLAQAQEAAQQKRPEIQNGQVAVQLAQVNLAKTKAGALPTISLGASLSTGYSDNRDVTYLKQLNTNFYQSVGINMSIPIYNKRVNKTNIAKSQILIDQAKLALLDTKNTLNQQVEQVYINWQNAIAQYTAANTQLKASEETYNITNEQLKYGSINMVELLQQKNTYVQATQSFIQAKYSSILYNKIYDFYAGVPVTLN
ncbi:TolC family protein [Pseudoflavitalea sp. X16]|uniref:TolC family protein n=1 Tax=Paraflavitalea devenefica TaxID=2716334 RepID=UPI00141EEABE|nr:TolC family protein [Paraflavitalea devenefica]NII25628.1 TolC family protein [Paraflavitalea devenefica]